jgi:hypothetical protein
MSGFPKLAYVCPIRWDELSGSEAEKFCSKCGHRVSNLSQMSAAERAALIERARHERICASFYLRATGEFVTREAPLTTEEASRVRQLGAVALSAGMLALATGCVSHPTQLPPPAAPTAAAPAPEEAIALQIFGVIASPKNAPR